MRKKLFGVLIAGTIVFLASCSKDVETSNLKVDMARKAPVKVYVYADLDKTKAGYEFVLPDTKVILSVNYAELSGNANKGKWIDTVKVGADGSFSTLVPVDDDGVTLNIEPIAFEAKQVRSYPRSGEFNMIFSVPAYTVNISTSSNAIKEILYKETKLLSQVDMITVNITVVGELDSANVGNKPVAGRELTVYNDGWMYKFTTDSKGKYQLQVPSDTTIYFEAKFPVSNKVGIDGKTKKNYTFNETTSRKFSSGAPTYDFTFNIGAGTETK